MNATGRLSGDHPPSWSSRNREELAGDLDELGAPEYRARQLYEAIHSQGASSWDAITSLPARFRDSLAQLRPLRAIRPQLDLVSRLDGTNKILFVTADGQHLESVLMRTGPSSGSRFTVCVSSQIGCPAACTFCASGLGGLMRNLTAPEIADQVEVFAGRIRGQGERIDNVVYMGMGEPFLNYTNVMSSIDRLRSESGLGLGARRITVSTVGIVPVIRRFAREAGEVNLAVSLHAPTDALRSEIVPYNHKFPIADIMSAIRDYLNATRRRVSFEYVLLQDRNDAPRFASDLGRLLKPMRPLVHVNLIPWNPFPEAGFSPASRRSAETFAQLVREAGVNTTVRYSKGLDIQAACGQLRRDAVPETMAS